MTESRSGDAPKPTRVLAALALAAVGFAATAGLQRPYVPLAQEYGLRAKFEAFTQSKDDYDAIYLGSSLVYRSFRPDIIDPLVSEATDRRFRSFNLGMAGMFTQETDALLDYILATRPSRLRWIVMQVPVWFGPAAHEQLGDNTRAVFAHAPRQTLMRLKHTNWRAMPRYADRLELLSEVADKTLRRYASTGLGPELFWRIAAPDESAFADRQTQFAATGGYASLDSEHEAEFIKRSRNFARNHPRFLNKLRQRDNRQTGIRTNVRNSYLYDVLTHAKARAERVGVDLVLVGMPTLEPNKLTTWLQSDEAAGAFSIIDLSDPKALPVLFDPSMRFDALHLNDAGAKEFSKSFADRFASVVGETKN